jgi:hypothetical protein
METRHGRIVVDVELDEEDALAGTVGLDGEREILSFTGWIGLFAALEDSVGAVRSEPADT